MPGAPSSEHCSYNQRISDGHNSLLFLRSLLVTTSKALVTTSFLLLLVRHLLLLAMHLLLL